MIHGLENQIGQLAKLVSKIPQGNLPCNTETNPKEQIKAITIRNVERLVEPEKKSKLDAIVKTFSQMPKYVNFLKELLTNKWKLDDLLTVVLNTVCSAIFQNKLPIKLKDPRSFTIPFLIGSLNVEKALANLRASINVMPYKMLKQLGLREPKPTKMSYQLTDKSIKYPRVIIEDVLTKVDKFIFPVDFVILDMDEDIEVPMILGRPLLATVRTVIDVGTGELMLRVGDEKITLQTHDFVRIPSEQDDTNCPVNVSNHVPQRSLQEIPHENLLEPCFRQSNRTQGESEERMVSSTN
ncbi:Retrovirus-related Pol polyprotein from transposon 17.6 [Gossypium australe]|uniref:Retrovirus-related Pol polyprotein from transposon 17.6 n=1 Tax=Gossypium australe TaxID=47621 RepID=A0A5B6X647_9ROSI|nr:Retrovirus-related Pol polyprotein from transposon 17.6 [Gossypium australe]